MFSKLIKPHVHLQQLHHVKPEFVLQQELEHKADDLDLSHLIQDINHIVHDELQHEE